MENLDKSFYYQCKECNRWRMIGTICKNPLTGQCDKDSRFFYKEPIFNATPDPNSDFYLNKKNTEMMANEYKGELKDFPKEVVERMLFLQEEEGNKRDVTVFEARPWADKEDRGFSWPKTPEGYDFWKEVIHSKRFNIFFMKYPPVVSVPEPKEEPENVFIPLPEKMMEVWDQTRRGTKRIVIGKKIVNGETFWYAWFGDDEMDVVRWKNAAELRVITMTKKQAEIELSDRMNEIIKIEG